VVFDIHMFSCIYIDAFIVDIFIFGIFTAVMFTNAFTSAVLPL
jgi:hypothetical protein